MKNLFILTLILGLFSTSLVAQRGTDKVSGALQEFNQTEFMRQYKDLKIKAESEITAFIGTSANYDPNDVAKVKIAYDRTAERFNSLLEKIKADFMNGQKLKYITKFPESYSRGLELDIRELSDFYSQNLQQTLADVTNNQQDGSALLILLMDLVKFSSSAIQHFKRIKQEARRYTDGYLNQHFIRPNRFKSWAELSGNSTYQDPYNTDPYNQNNTDPYNNNTYSDPYNQNTTDPYNQNNNTYDPYNQNNTTDPYNQNNNTYDPYNQNNTTDPYNQNNNNYDPYNQNNNNTNPYNYDGQAKKDSLNKYFPSDSTKQIKLQQKQQLDGTNLKVKTPKRDTLKANVNQTYEQYKANQRKKLQKKNNTEPKKKN